MRSSHEIRNYFHINNLKIRLICNICEANYLNDINLSKFKKYFAKYHKDLYLTVMAKHKEKNKQIKENNLQKEKERIHLITQNNETGIQILKPVQVAKFNEEENYTTKEEIEEVIKTNQT